MSGGLVTSAVLAALVFELKLFYVWLSLPLAASIGLAVSVVWLRSGRWRRVVL